MKKILALLFILVSLPLHAGQVSVSAPKWWAEGNTTSVAFDLSAPTKYTFFTLDNPNRLVVDFRDARYTGNRNMPVAGHPLIKRIRGGVRKGGDYRVVLDLSGKVDASSFVSSQGKRVILELRGDHGAPILVRHEKPASKPAPAPQPVATRTPAPRSQAMASQPRLNTILRRPAISTGRDVVVVIDAGHGGHDIGAQGQHGTREKDVVLGISKRLANLINQEEGMRAVLTRDGDYFIKLRDRMRIARDAKADLFVSVHANGYKNGLAKGASIFILSPSGASSEAAKLLAEKENSAESIGNIELYDKDDDLKAVLIDLSQAAIIQESHDVAARVLNQMKGLGRIHMSSVQKAGFAVLKSPDVPSILVETAFITNPGEERKLRSASQQEEYARAILAGAREYFYSNPPRGTLIAEKVRHERSLAGIERDYSAIPES